MIGYQFTMFSFGGVMEELRKRTIESVVSGGFGLIGPATFRRRPIFIIG